MIPITRLFCDIDDFCKEFKPRWNGFLIGSGQEKHIANSELSLSEVMTAVILFRSSDL